MTDKPRIIQSHGEKENEQFAGLNFKDLTVAFEYARQQLPNINLNPAHFVGIALMKDLMKAGVNPNAAFHRAQEYVELFDYMHDTLMAEVADLGRELAENMSQEQLVELAVNHPNTAKEAVAAKVSEPQAPDLPSDEAPPNGWTPDT